MNRDRWAIYVRSASNEPSAFEAQEAVCRALVPADTEVHVMRDHGSGLQVNEVLRSFLRDAPRLGIGALVVSEPNRLSRDPAIAAHVMQQLESHGIKVIFALHR